MEDKEDSGYEQFKKKRALLLDYLEHASNVIAKKVTEVAIPERSMKAKKEDKKTASKDAAVSASPFTNEAQPESEKVVMEVPIKAPEIFINPSEVDKLLYLRQKRNLLESVLDLDEKSKQEKSNPPVEATKTGESLEKKQPEAPAEIKPAAIQKAEVKTSPAKPANLSTEVKKPKPEFKASEEKKDLPALPLRQRWENHKNKLKKNLHRKGVRRLGRSVRRFAYGSATFALGFYLSYLLLVYSFAPRNALFEQLAGQLPAPALVSNYGLVDFYSYQQIKASKESFAIPEDPSMMALKWQIINSLAGHYGVDQDLDQDLLLEVLKRKVVGDSSMNYYGSRKFLELKQAVRRGGSLAEVAETTDLTIHRGAYTKKLAAQQFGDLVYGLQLNALSPVIINDQGIYLLSVLSTSDTRMEFDYLFVPARTLSQLINEKMADAWIVSLVD